MEEDYSWIKVKKYVMDESKSWEERYKELESHHVKEVTFLLKVIAKLRKLLTLAVL